MANAGHVEVLDIKTLQCLNQFINSTEKMQDVTHDSYFTREAVVGNKVN